MSSELPALVAGFLLCLVGAFILPRVWAGWYVREDIPGRVAERSPGDVALFWWPYGEASRRGALRGLVAAIGAVWSLFLAALAALLSTDFSSTSSHVLRVLGIIFLVLAVCLLAMHFTIMFFNRPKFMVPPCQRGEAGVLQGRTSKSEDPNGR
jgi:hypothetical protein